MPEDCQESMSIINEIAALEESLKNEQQSRKPNGYDDQGWCGEND